jgi:hypothetical protein
MVVDPNVTPWYHCVSRCVRRAFLCGGEFAHRKQWIEDRLRELVEIFAIDCGGFAIMDNHLHVLLRLEPARALAWSNEEVARRWLRLFPLRSVDGQALPAAASRVEPCANDATTIAVWRRRLADLSWFMKSLKEPLARMANREEKVSGAFWAARFRSVAILDETSLLATAASIDLNPLAAGVSPTPEQSEHTSFRARIDHCRAEGLVDTLRDGLSTETREPSQESGIWLLPVEDRRPEVGARPGLMAGLTLSCYSRLIDWTSRLLREGKTHVPSSVAPLFDRLRANPEEWASTVSRLVNQAKRTGSHFGPRERLIEAARSHGRHWHRNQLPRLPGSPSAAA